MKTNELILWGRIALATLIIAATIYMMITRIAIADAWWALATATVSYLFPQARNGVTEHTR